MDTLTILIFFLVLDALVLVGLLCVAYPSLWRAPLRAWRRWRAPKFLTPSRRWMAEQDRKFASFEEGPGCGLRTLSEQYAKPPSIVTLTEEERRAVFIAAREEACARTARDATEEPADAWDVITEVRGR